MRPPEISPFAILAAVLTNAGESHKVYTKVADTDAVTESLEPIVQVKRSDFGFAMAIPIKFVEHFVKNPHGVALQVVMRDDDANPENAILVLSFAPEEKSTRLLAPDGSKIGPRSAVEKVAEDFLNKDAANGNSKSNSEKNS